MNFFKILPILICFSISTMAQKLPAMLEFTHVVTASYTVDDELITIDFLVNSINGTAGIRGISNQPEFKMLYVGVNGDVYIF